METQYDNLNKKLDHPQLKGQQYIPALQNNQKHQQPQFYPRVKNLTEIKLTKEEMKLLNLGFQYSIETPLTTYSTNHIMETKNVIKLLDTKWQNAYRILATKQLKQILNSNNSYNILHKRQLYVIKQLKQKLVTKKFSYSYK